MRVTGLLRRGKRCPSAVTGSASQRPSKAQVQNKVSGPGPVSGKGISERSRSNPLIAQLDLNDANRIEPRVLSIAVQIWVAGLVGKDARSTNQVVVRPVIMTVDPERRLVFL